MNRVKAAMNIIKEGKAEILGGENVFYNHIQQFNRDLSVMAIKGWNDMYGSRYNSKRTLDDEKSGNNQYLKVLEALSATGLRSIRYAKEIEAINQVVANDLLPDAVKLIRDNIDLNHLQDKVTANQGDAIKYMASTNTKFHAVDLDPYGTAAPFLDSAIQCLKDDGILLVTCTDAGVLAGSGYPEKCFALYGGNNFGNTFIGSELNHEVGIRLILQAVATTAAKYKKTIEPLLSLSIDYYFRLIIKVNTSAIEVKNLAANTMLTYHCIGCGDKHNQYLGRKVESGDGQNKQPKYQTPRSIINTNQCEYCESNYNIAGPMYGGTIHNKQFIDTLLQINDDSDKDVYKTTERIKGMLTLAKNELDLPFYFNLNLLCSYFKTPPISINEFSKALGNLGYKVSLTHAKKNCIKTDAPWEIVLMINRHWLIDKNLQLVDQFNKGLLEKTEKLTNKVEILTKDPSTNLNLSETMIGYKILKHLNAKSDANELRVDFVTDNAESDKIRNLRKLKMVRYQENPKNWGPKAKPSKKSEQ